MTETPFYPPTVPYATGMLPVSDLHTLNYEQVGKPDGRPALFLHGGPGLGINPAYRRFFDPAFFRTVLLDQRGAGKSRPSAELTDNTTWHLVEDLEALRSLLGIKDWVVMGGSWGSLLGLCYAIRYPESVAGLILRGVFLGRPRDLSWIYEGAGTGRLFPELWQAFRALVPGTEAADTVAAYYALMASGDETTVREAARSWALWASSTGTLLPDPAVIAAIEADEAILAKAKIECHYAHHRCFLPSANYVLENASRIKDIPCHIVHGRYDVVCAVDNAYDLHQALPNSNLTIVPDGAHSPMEPTMAAALIHAADQFKTV